MVFQEEGTENNSQGGFYHPSLKYYSAAVQYKQNPVKETSSKPNIHQIPVREQQSKPKHKSLWRENPKDAIFMQKIIP